MSADGPDTRWFNLGALREAEATQARAGQRWLGGFAGAMVAAGVGVALLVKGASTTVLVVYGAAAFIVLSAVAAIMWLRGRREPERPSGLNWLGVDRTGVWWKAAEGDAHMPWENVGGVRVHSIPSPAAGGPPRHSVYLDLLHPNQPAIGPRESGAAVPYQRTALPDAVGVYSPGVFQLATRIGLELRAARPDLWRGFTTSSSSGNVEFQSWERAGYTQTESLRHLFRPPQNPDGTNFGGWQPGPPR